MTHFNTGFVLLICSLLLGCFDVKPTEPITPKSVEFVEVEGKRFSIGGDDYVYIGANLWFGAYLGAGQNVGDRERLIRELDLLKSVGVTNLRVLGASEESPLKNSVTPTFRGRTNSYNENLLQGLDFLLDEMSKRDMKAVIYVNNFWEWSGGMATYLYWTRGEIVDPSDPLKPWPAYPDFTSKFYADEAANKSFKAYLEALIKRVNTRSGIAYIDDPTIMSWQLANEPRPGYNNKAGIDNLQNFYTWIDETAKFIKSLDPNHLVSSGNEGRMGCIQNIDCFVEAHETENIDYLTFHMWPKNWGWIDASDMQGTYPKTIESAKAYIDEHIQYADRLNKPIVLEEFGMERDVGAILPTSSTLYRDKFYGFIFDEILQSVKSGGPFVGSNFWSWGGYGRAATPDGQWVKDGRNNYTGDPPQEPQGLNSVFDTDVSTLNVIRNHGNALNDVDL